MSTCRTPDASSRGFHKLTGRDVVGSSWEALLEGADENRVSRSMVQAGHQVNRVSVSHLSGNGLARCVITTKAFGQR